MFSNVSFIGITRIQIQIIHPAKKQSNSSKNEFLNFLTTNLQNSNLLITK